MIMQPFPAKTRKRVKFMSYTKIAAIYADSEALSGQTVTVGGWVRTIRDMKTFGFIELNDGSCFKNLQVVMEAGTLENYKDIAAQNVGAALIVTGTVVLTPEAKQPLELKAAEIAVRTVREFLEQQTTSVERVIFNVFKDLDAAIYRRLLGPD